MGREVRLFKSQERMGRAEASAFLRQLADKLEAGTVLLRQGPDELALQIPARVVLEVQVEDEDKKRKGVQHSLEVEIKWFDGDEGPASLELG